MVLWRKTPILLALALASVAPAFADTEQAPTGWIERMCSPQIDGSKRAEWMQRRADRLAERLQLTDAQKAAWADLQETRAKLRADRRAALCASKPDLSTFEARLEFRQTRLENRLADMKLAEPKLIAFYNSLSDYQRGEFDAMRRSRPWGRRDPG